MLTADAAAGAQQLVGTRGELFDWLQIRPEEWICPTLAQLEEMRNLLHEFLIDYRLMQKDVCSFTGLAPPYLSFMAKDPSVANFSQDRKREVYSVLNKFFTLVNDGAIDNERLRTACRTTGGSRGTTTTTNTNTAATIKSLQAAMSLAA
eukprot:GHVU01194188.1.p1 GENE.GHVU01194188.1~~GHVU01194188.1.p1  ORF type:complete len:149 (-),score=26.16 GHVU01194188.1:305-751(-)